MDAEETTTKERSEKFDLRAFASRFVWLIAPLLVGIYPVLFFYASNLEEAKPHYLNQPLLVVVVVTLVMTAGMRWVLRDGAKAGLLVAFWWLLFFFYGRVFDLVEEATSKGTAKNLAWIWIVLAVGAIAVAWLLGNFRHKLLQLVTIIGAVLVVMQLAPIAQHTFAKREKALEDFSHLLANDLKVQQPTKSERPDIYYIMLDSYPRTDTLKEYFDYDNSDFDRALTDQGFNVLSKSHSNYNQTYMSVPATMNMSYFKDPKVENGITNGQLLDLYRNNRTVNWLRDMGYKFVNNSNLYSTQGNRLAHQISTCTSTNEFLQELINTTPLKGTGLIANQARRDKRSDALCVIDYISNHKDVGGPKFVFTHLLPPHPPYLFGQNGEDVQEVNLSLTAADRWLAKKPYVDQMIYLNKRVLEAVDKIKAKTPDAIIIIQSDHGTFSSATEATTLNDKRPHVLTERARNYTAIHLPEHCDQSLFYDSMTNVNTFRLLFNACFGTKYPTLKDRVFYIEPRDYRNFRDITKVVGP